MIIIYMQRLQISFGPDYCDNFISSCTKRLHILKIFMVVETRHIEFQPTVLFSRIFLLIECLKKTIQIFYCKRYVRLKFVLAFKKEYRIFHLQ